MRQYTWPEGLRDGCAACAGASRKLAHWGVRRAGFCLLTARSGGLGVGKEDYARLALVEKLLEGRLGAIIGLNLAAKSVKVDDVADSDLLGGSLGCRDGSLICLSSFGGGSSSLCFCDSLLLGSGGLFGLAGSGLFGSRSWDRLRRLALAKRGRHCA